jgi:alpha-galactosidase
VRPRVRADAGVRQGCAVTSRLHALHSPTTTVLLTHDDDVPRVLHWGRRLGDGPYDVAALEALLDAPVPHGGLDSVPPLSVLPEQVRGWASFGGIAGHRTDGTAWVPLLARTASEATASSFTWTGTDTLTRLRVTITVVLDGHGVLAVSTSLTNDGDDAYTLDSLAPVVPLPARAAEAMVLTGRWAHELQASRHALGPFALVRETRKGRTSHESAPTIAVGTRSFGEQQGEVWLAHLAWSGNHRVSVETLPDGRRVLSMSDLLLPGEGVLAPGETYDAPAVLGTWSASGLTTASQQFHEHVRARLSHPRTPRPILLNTWEAVYFEHDVTGLQRLADAAASVGVERFVLDDGWFRGRDDDTSSLGDWYVDERKYPHGLGELADHVVGLGLEFGLWVEPEMVNPDSDLYRAHPDWVLHVDGHEPLLGRHQLVLDLGRAEVFDYLLERLDALLGEHPIAYLKWDHNRELVAASYRGGAAGVRRQTLALYALLDELKRRHPNVEIESCSSGGGRIDLGIAARTDRFWTSDCNDALERQTIQRGFSYLLPPELMGAHVGGAWSHTTARTQTLPFRAATALFGHLGFEWDLSTASAEDRAGVAQVIEVHKRFRPLLHGGRVVRVDHPGDTAILHGVVAHDGSEALFCYAQLMASDATVPAPARLVGLDPARRYRVERVLLPGANWDMSRHHPGWYDAPVEVAGDVLAEVGLPMGVHVPEQATLIHATAL